MIFLSQTRVQPKYFIVYTHIGDKEIRSHIHFDTEDLYFSDPSHLLGN